MSFTRTGSGVPARCRAGLARAGEDVLPEVAIRGTDAHARPVLLDSVPDPGGLSVPPLHGWQGVAVALVAVLVVGVVFLACLALGAARSARRGSPEWEAWLDARSRERHGVPGPGGPPGS